MTTLDGNALLRDEVFKSLEKMVAGAVATARERGKVTFCQPSGDRPGFCEVTLAPSFHVGLRRVESLPIGLGFADALALSDDRTELTRQLLSLADRIVNRAAEQGVSAVQVFVETSSIQVFLAA